ncbi:LOW QUALITY PROTEIN: uncharacterized protein F21D5.5-like [Armigeres subalbatus]|uniref:LOW QUALITY PROTEIN: uncharacterized protein F21D5.5-like n=1 Tax=Armigeres subalbatus TaxID=124917 RepID=UPI002ED4163B
MFIFASDLHRFQLFSPVFRYIIARKMNKSLKQCFIKPLLERHPAIQIDTERKIIGRSPETLIQDPCCSRQQVCLKANFKGGFVLVKSLGSNPSVLNGKQLEKNMCYEAYDGDILELLPGQHQYTFVFKFEENPEDKHTKSKDKPVDKKQHNGKEKDKRESHKRSLSKSDVEETESQSKKKKDEQPQKDKSLSRTTSTDKDERMKTPVPAVNNKWEDIDSKLLYIFTSKDVVASDKIAAYDLDGTLIKTKSGNVFPKTIDDWQIAFPEVPGKLKSLHKNGFKIVLFTNQAGISKGKLKIEDFKQKMESIQVKLNVPFQAFVSTGKGKYRKPLPGMWDTLCQLKNDGIKPDKARSFYVGDAAGRPEQKKPIKRKKDFSCGDRLMAINIGIPFFIPEVHFQNAKDHEWTKPEFNPKEALQCSELLSPAGSKLISSQPEVIIMVGFPGSGKSHFVKTHLESKGYVSINRDTLGSWQKCASLLETTLHSGKRAVVDNTNADIDSRKRFVDIAKKKKVPCRCFKMSASYKQAKHNNTFRELTNRNHATINEMVFNMYKSKYQEPSLEEGYDEIVLVNFRPKFESSADEKLYKMYLLEN